MADIWTNAIMVPYIGVAASVGYDLTKKEILVIGLNSRYLIKEKHNLKIKIMI